MKTIYLILLFLAPGLLVRFVEDATSTSGGRISKKGTVYEQLTVIVADSIIITAIQIGAINLCHFLTDKTYLHKLSTLFDKFDDLTFLGFYILLCIVVSILHILFIKRFARWLTYSYRVKKYGKKDLKPLDKEGNTIWQKIIYDTHIIKDIPREDTIAVIYNHAEYVTAGVINGMNSSKEEGLDLRLIRVAEIEEIIEDDMRKPYRERIGKPVFEYYSIDTGLRIRFYKPNRFIDAIEERRENKSANHRQDQ